LGDLSGTAANSFEISLQSPGSTLELHIGAAALSSTDSFVRFPNNTEVFFGNRSGGDNAPIEIIGEDKIVNLRTLSDTAIGSGPYISFDGQFSSSGDEGSATIRQQARGLYVDFSTAGDFLRSSQGLAVADGIVEPTALSGSAIIYVDSTSGDLKVIFGNGFVATIAADS
jgi:hypothetical protein